MSAPGLTTSLRTETFQHLQLNAGMFLKDFDYSSISDKAALKSALAAAKAAGTQILGATRGGGTFTVTRDIRTPEVDGMRYGFIGSDFVDSTDAQITTTLVEATPENFALLLGTGDATTSGSKTTIKMRTAIEASDYLENICWVGDLADGRYVLICLKNALNTADFSLTFTDKGEGTLAVEFHARQANVSDYDEAPFEVVFFDGTASSAMTVGSAVGTNVGETTITTNHSLASGQHYVYKVGTNSTAPTITYPDYTWTEWDGSSKINVGTSNNGNKITVAVVNNSNVVVKYGSATLVVKTT